MSLVNKIKPVGVDIQIQGFQSVMYPYLKTKWPVNDNTFNCYGRAYRNQTTDGFVPQIFEGNADAGKIEYTPVLFDDNLKALCFFIIGDSTKYDAGSAIAKVALIFTVDIVQLKPTIIHRADEEIRNDVEKFACQKRFGFSLTGIETGIDAVFKEFSGWKKVVGIKYRDMQPLHCFRLNFDLLYNINDC
jgi:hypothetical protein